MTDEEFEEMRRPYLEAIMELQRSYERAAAPYLKRLTEIEMFRPIRFLVTAEQVTYDKPDDPCGWLRPTSEGKLFLADSTPHKLPEQG